MALRDGTYRLGAQSGRLLVKTSRTGLGARAGHDLTIEVRQWDATVAVDTNDPGKSSVTAEIDTESFHVVSGTGGVKPLSTSDRSEIERNVRRVLHTARHRTIAFRSTAVEGAPDSFEVRGDLTIMGSARPVTLRGAVDDDDVVRAGVTVTQSAWGIKPYSAFFGALKLADDVVIEIDAKLVRVD